MTCAILRMSARLIEKQANEDTSLTSIEVSMFQLVFWTRDYIKWRLLLDSAFLEIWRIMHISDDVIGEAEFLRTYWQPYPIIAKY